MPGETEIPSSISPSPLPSPPEGEGIDEPTVAPGPVPPQPAEAHAGLAQLTGPDLRGVGAGAQTRWQGVVVSIEPRKTPQEILVAAERELIEAYLRGARHLILLPRQNLLYFAEDQPAAARILRELRTDHAKDPTLMLDLDIHHHSRERTGIEATFCVLPPASDNPDPKPVVAFELPQIDPDLRQAITMVGFRVDDLFLLTAGLSPQDRKYTLTRLGSFLNLRQEIPEPWEEKDHLMNLSLRITPRDRALFFIALKALATMYSLRKLHKELIAHTERDVFETTLIVLRERAEWLLTDGRRDDLGDADWIRKVRVALNAGLARSLSDRLYGEDLRGRLLTAYLEFEAQRLSSPVSIPAALKIVSSLMMQDSRERAIATIEPYWQETGWEGLERFVRVVCHDLAYKGWMVLHLEEALSEVPRYREEKRWRRIADPLLPKGFQPDQIRSLVDGIPVTEQGPLADHTARLVGQGISPAIADDPQVARLQLVRWLEEIPFDQRLTAVRYLRTLVAGNFLDEAVRALKQSAANGRTKALRTAVHLEASALLSQVTDAGAQWYDDAGLAARRMAVFCLNRDSSDKLFEAILRSFGYEDLRDEVPTVARQLFEVLLQADKDSLQLTALLSRIHARSDLHTIYSVACSFFSGMEDLPEAMEKLRLLEAVWVEVGKKGGGRGGAVSPGVSGVMVEALSRAHTKGLKRAAKVLQGMAQLAVAGKLTPSHLSRSNLNRLLISKGFGHIVNRLGTIDRIVLVAASSVRRNEGEIAAYLESRGFISAAAIPTLFPGALSVPSLGSSALRVVPTLP